MSALIDRMRGRGLELVNVPTSGPGDATEIVRSFLPRGVEIVAVCGGDGTVSEAANGLAGADVPLAVLPGGTSNVLAVELGIPLSVEKAEDLLVTGVPRDIRFGHVDGRLFLLWAGVGIDARIMGQMNLLLKRHLGRAGIFGTALSEFLQYEFPRLEVEIDGVEAPRHVRRRLPGAALRGELDHRSRRRPRSGRLRRAPLRPPRPREPLQALPGDAATAGRACRRRPRARGARTAGRDPRPRGLPRRHPLRRRLRAADAGRVPNGERDATRPCAGAGPK